jgi:hypothetical protein
MIRSVASKVMWVGRATVFLMGLALMLALVFGIASTAFGANGGNFILGSLNNTATAITKLTGTVGGGPALQVSNPSTATGSTALDLQVATGKAPMKVNRTTKVANLNSDLLDGKSSEVLGSHANMTTNVVDSNLPTFPNDFSGPAQGVATLPVSVPGNTSQVVKLDGYLELNDTMGPGAGCPCEFRVEIFDTTTQTSVGTATQTFFGTDTEGSNWSMSLPVLMAGATPVSHTYFLTAKLVDRDTIVDNVSFDVSKVRLIAQTIPFGS